MAGPMAAEGGLPRRPLLRYGLAGLGLAALALLLLQLLVGRRLTAQRQQGLADELASRLVLSELALERLTPASLAATGDMRLAVGSSPEGSAAAAPGASSHRQRSGSATAFADPLLLAQARDLRQRLCGRLGRCPRVRPALQLPRGVWVALESPLETVWLFVALPPFPGWPPDPLLLALALGQTPDLLVMDEPAAGVDFHGELVFCEILERQRRQRGFTQLMVSHDLATVTHHATHVICLNRRVAAEGPPREVLTTENLTAVFGLHMGLVDRRAMPDGKTQCSSSCCTGKPDA